MGMIQTILKACKPEVDASAYHARLCEQARSLESCGDQEGDRPEHATVIKVSESNFEELWKVQENRVDTPEWKEKALQQAKEGRLFAIEIDW